MTLSLSSFSEVTIAWCIRPVKVSQTGETQTSGGRLTLKTAARWIAIIKIKKNNNNTTTFYLYSLCISMVMYLVGIKFDSFLLFENAAKKRKEKKACKMIHLRMW